MLTDWLVIAILLVFLFGMAGALSYAHSTEEKECVKAGYRWSATKYVCVVDLKK